MITEGIERHKVLVSINHNCYNFRKQKIHLRQEPIITCSCLGKICAVKICAVKICLSKKIPQLWKFHNFFKDKWLLKDDKWIIKQLLHRSHLRNCNGCDYIWKSGYILVGGGTGGQSLLLSLPRSAASRTFVPLCFPTPTLHCVAPVFRIIKRIRNPGLTFKLCQNLTFLSIFWPLFCLHHEAKSSVIWDVQSNGASSQEGLPWTDFSLPHRKIPRSINIVFDNIWPVWPWIAFFTRDFRRLQLTRQWSISVHVSCVMLSHNL